VQVRLSDLSMPGARSRAVAFVIGSTVFICGGLTGSGATTTSILAMDLPGRRVDKVGDLAVAVHDAGGASVDGSGFVFGGGDVLAGRVVQQVGATGHAVTVGDLPADRADLASIAVDGEILVVGGGTPAGPTPTVLATTDGTRFRVVARLAVPVRYPAVAAVGGVVYIVGGSTPTGDTRAIQVLDPLSGEVRVIGHLPAAMSHAAALAIDGTVFIAGGRVAGRAQNAVWRLDTSAGTVTRVARLPYGLSDAAAVVVDGTGYLIGGEGGSPVASILELTMH
jgi:N-acetylneuraminic acid mutarotase